ncbi:alpha/beta hydrolase [Actinobacillus suis]|uniref:Phospholipase/carboxylesterase n=2 Tax=Actinobacillus suis TaxID=716 RepID=K0GBG0_ACTSU|nr:phospholipase [Actinobacillus suis]AFU19045.1 phospholipase/carboxylesterase [Actinobacillus suis H91-0380]AIJ31123.1 phospholipase/carboxylesterase [Actinobacillus suis ATCC 33415]MCO4166769.1 alpha/beta hydrolase [Actinobacillus suis]MCO4168553.1 alpha/beta hydrolase [Actinobacillus suis]MCQ9628742.1 alpha/beta hydrolase [Actinobacillus suis]
MADILIPHNEPLIIPSGKNPENSTACVIFLHGLTTSGLQFRPIAEYLAESLPNVKFVLPSAPVRFIRWANAPVSGWYDLLGDNFLIEEDESGIQCAANYVHKLIDEQITQGIPSEKIFLSGFSQGCAISLLAGTTYSKPLGGIVGLSGYLPLTNQWQDNGYFTPILWLHGSQDPLITLTQIEQGKLMLAKNRDFTFKTYPIEHFVAMPEIDEMGRWIRTKL